MMTSFVTAMYRNSVVSFATMVEPRYICALFSCDHKSTLMSSCLKIGVTDSAGMSRVLCCACFSFAFAVFGGVWVVSGAGFLNRDS
eukprot:26217_6